MSHPARGDRGDGPRCGGRWSDGAGRGDLAGRCLFPLRGLFRAPAVSQTQESEELVDHLVEVAPINRRGYAGAAVVDLAAVGADSEPRLVPNVIAVAFRLG